MTSAFDKPALCQYLTRLDPAYGDPERVTVQPFEGGASNLTALVQCPGARDLVVRRAPPGRKAATAHDMVREARILTRIRPHFPLAPEVYAVCEEPDVLGTPFFVMERLVGAVPGRKLPGRVDPAQARALCDALVGLHVKLHAIDLDATDLRSLGNPDGYVARQVKGWTERYRAARTDDVPDCAAITAWLDDNRPEESGASLIHNDFKFDNLVLCPDDLTRIIGVLDWEMATIGDPLMDLGASLAYWVDRDDPPELHAVRTLPTTVPGMMTRQEIIDRYLELSGRRGGDFTFYYVYGLFRLAVIAQQIYLRYTLGQSKNPIHGQFGLAVNVLARHAERVIEQAAAGPRAAPPEPATAEARSGICFDPGTRVLEMRELARRFLDKEVIPLELPLLQRGLEPILPTLAQLRARARETGLFAPHMPAELGGAGLTLLEQAQLSEILGRSLLGHYVFNFNAPDVGNMELLSAYGTPAQKQRWLVPLVRGDIRSTFLMTEPEHAGSNPVWMSTTARRDGDQWVLRGHKWFATAADGAEIAIVMAISDPDAPSPYQRATMFLVPTDSEGFALVRNIPVMGHAGGGAFSHGECMLHGVRVPADAVLGPVGGGFLLAQTRLGPGRIHHATRWVGVCERALDLMCRRAAERELSPGHPLAGEQTVQTWIADSRAEIEAARLMVLHAAWKIEKHGEYREDVSLIKYFVAGVLQRVLDRAIQVHGALGMTDDTPLAFWYRHERAARIYDGPDEVHRRVVARSILKGYGVTLGRAGKK